MTDGPGPHDVDAGSPPVEPAEPPLTDDAEPTPAPAALTSAAPLPAVTSAPVHAAVSPAPPLAAVGSVPPVATAEDVVAEAVETAVEIAVVEDVPAPADQAPRGDEAAAMEQSGTDGGDTTAPAAEPTPAEAADAAAVEAAAAVAAAEAAASQAAAAAAVAQSGGWGWVDADGTVYVRAPEGDIAVGQWAAGQPEAGLAFFARKYEDLATEVDLAQRRLREGKSAPDQAVAVARKVREALVQPTCVGDLATLRARCDAVEALADERRASVARERAQARAAALAARERLVAEAESLADSAQWKVTGERFRALLDEWKAAPRVDRGKEQELWKRFSHARSTFDKRRRQYFAALDAQRKEASGAKEVLVAEAESLAESTDWAATARAFRSLMDRWKAAPRASRQDEERLWQRFRAAQDRFFGARNAALDQRDSGQRENLSAKEALVAEAEALLPVTDLRSAKAALRSIHERWERIGHVPRQDRDRIEARLHRVEDAIRRTEADEWRRTDPAARARAEDTVAMFQASVDQLTAKRDKAIERGDERAANDAQRRLDDTLPLLAAAERALADFTG